MTAILHLDTDVARALARQLAYTAGEMRARVEGMAGSVSGMVWLSPARSGFEADFEQTRRALLDRAAACENFGERLMREADEWEAVAASYQSSVTRIAPASPSGTDMAHASESEWHEPISDVVGFLDNLLKPIEWASDSEKAWKQFNGVLEQIGRLLNQIGQTRGYIKQMREFGELLKGAQKTFSVLDNLLSINDYRRYLNGEITNAEIASRAISNLIPIPFLNERIGEWFKQHTPDPNGKWRGLAPPAY